MSVILVTGATGMVGRTIVLELLKKGKKVRALKRKEHGPDEFKTPFNYYTPFADCLFDSMQWIDADINDKISINKALSNVSEVYHCAAMVSYDPKKENHIKKVNIDGTAILLECCRDQGIEKFLYISSSAVFKTVSREILITETSDFIDIPGSTVYALSKYYATKMVKASGLKTIILYPGMIIGNVEKKNDDPSMLQVLAEGSYTFHGGAGCIDVRDVATIAVTLMEKGFIGEDFLIAAENHSYQELSRMIKEDLDKPASFLFTEELLNVGRFLNTITFGIFPQLRLLSRQNIQFLSMYQKLSSKKLADRLDYKFIPVRESLHFHLTNYIIDSLTGKKLSQ